MLLAKDFQTSTSPRPAVHGKEEAPQLKIEIPANRCLKSLYAGWSVMLTVSTRYDMLCFEGIALMLNIFRGKTSSPNYRLSVPSDGELQTIIVHKEVSYECQNLARSGLIVWAPRHRKFDHTYRALFCEISSSQKRDTTPSLRFRISSTKILHGSEP